MACKMECPKCNKMLKQEGDEGKQARGEYRVYDSLWNDKHDEGKFRLAECLLCGFIAHMRVWGEHEFKTLKNPT